MKPRTPTDVEIARNIQHALIDHGINSSGFNAYLRELWGIKRHAVTKILKGQSEVKNKYLRLLAEETGLDMASFFE